MAHRLKFRSKGTRRKLKDRAFVARVKNSGSALTSPAQTPKPTPRASFGERMRGAFNKFLGRRSASRGG